MMSRNSPYRTLLAVYVVAILAGVCEYFGRTGSPAREEDIYGDPVRNLPEAIWRLYPGSSDAEYLKGRQREAAAGRRIQQQKNLPLSQAMSELDAGLRDAAGHYERAIGLGLKSEESLIYNYALALIRTRAEPARIDQAIAEWRRNFPYSTRRDLSERRQAIEEQMRKLPVVTRPGDLSQRGLEPGNHTEAALHVVPEWRSPPSYVGSQACQQCHPHEFESYLKTAHSRSLAEVRPEDEPANAVFDHTASGRRFRVARRDGQMFHEESLVLDDGTEFPLTSLPVRYRAGSGHYARTYVCEQDEGFLFESPVTWYESAQAWSMTPGFDKPEHRSFSRPVLENCLRCHCGCVAVGTESTFRLRVVEQAIGCERCHGPGEAHVKLRVASRDAQLPGDPIVNPRRLSRKLAEAACQQCHLQADFHIPGQGVWEMDYRPGQPLEKFQTVYRKRKDEAGMTVVGHVEQLGESACYRGSESLNCVTCHDPHRFVAPDERIEHYRSICQTCHSDPECKLSSSIRQERSGNDCVQCHMPKSATEVPHVAFTHHHIGIHPLKNAAVDDNQQDLLVSLLDLSGFSDDERQRSLMLARFEMLMNRGVGFQKSAAGQQLAGQLERWFQTLPPGGDVPVEFARTQFLFNRGNVAAAVQSAEHALGLKDLRTAETTLLLNQLGLRDLTEHRNEQACVRFGKLVRLQCSGEDWYYLGLSEEACGRSGAALLALEKARRLQPASVETYDALATIHHRRGEIENEQRRRADIERLKRPVAPSVQFRSGLP